MAGGATRLRVAGCDGRTRGKANELSDQTDLDEQTEEVQDWKLDLIKHFEEDRHWKLPGRQLPSSAAPTSS